MDPKLANFLNGLQLAAGLACVDYSIRNLHTAGFDFGFADALTKRVILTVLGKVQSALLKASQEQGFVLGVNGTLEKQPEPVVEDEPVKTGWN